jgi:hypothetical protein
MQVANGIHVQQSNETYGILLISLLQNLFIRLENYMVLISVLFSDLKRFKVHFTIITCQGAVVVVIVWLLDLQLYMQSTLTHTCTTILESVSYYLSIFYLFTNL